MSICSLRSCIHNLSCPALIVMNSNRDIYDKREMLKFLFFITRVVIAGLNYCNKDLLNCYIPSFN